MTVGLIGGVGAVGRIGGGDVASFISGAVTDLRFDRGQYLLNSAVVPASQIDAYHTRASARWAERADGAWQEFATNAAALIPQRGYDAREGHAVLNRNPLNLRAWTLVGGSATNEAGTFLGFSSARRVISGGQSFHRIQGDILGGIVTGQTYAVRAIYAAGTSGRCRVGVRSAVSTVNGSINAGAVGDLVAVSKSIGTWSAIENINHGSGIYEFRAILTAAVTEAATFEVGPDSATTGADVVVIAAQIVQRGYQMPFGTGTVAADVMVVPADAAGMAVNPAASGLTMFWRGRDFQCATAFPKLLDLRLDSSNRMTIERRSSDGRVYPVFSGPAGVSDSLNFGTLAELPYGSEYTAVATWRPDGSVWLKGGAVAASTGTGRTMLNVAPSGLGVGAAGSGGHQCNSITRRCGLLPYSLSDGDALSLFNQINEGL